MIHLTVIGSGTVAPQAERTSAAHWVEAGDVRLLLDCGAGTLHRAAQFGIPWHRVTHVALTHFHVDHWGELGALLFALRYGIEPSRQEPLELLGPVGLETRVTLLASALGDWVRDPGYLLTVTEIPPGTPRVLADGVVLEACDTPHTPESQAYSVRAGGARLVYTGDTGPSAALARWARGCDLLLAECSVPEERAMEIHLTPRTAGELARGSRAGRLVLTHFYPVFGDADPAALAAEVYEGPVVAARDGERFTVARSEAC